MVHEAHTVYRRERSSRPNLTLPATALFPSGEVAASSATNAVLFFRDALTAELNQQRAASQAILDQSQQLLTNIHSLSDQAHSLQQSTDSFGRDDLLVLAKVADATHTWICGQGQEREADAPAAAEV